MKIVQNQKQTGSDTEEEDDCDDDEEMPEEIGTPTSKVYDTSERDGRYAPIRTNPEEGALQLHTDGEISGENSKTNIRRSTRDSKKPNIYDIIPYAGNFGVRNKITKKRLYLLLETFGPEKREHQCRRKFKSQRIFYKKKERPQDHQARIEKEKRKRGKCYIRVHSGS